jgi:hypothetical protein
MPVVGSNLPTDLEDLEVYGSDPAGWRFTFVGAPDLIASVFTFAIGDATIPNATIGMEDAALGIIYARLTGAEVDVLPRVVDWDFAEVGIYNRTLLKGRIIHQPNVAT